MTDIGYCIKKYISQLDNPKYKDLPQFAACKEHGRGNPVTICRSSSEHIADMDWEEFLKVYQID